MRECHDLQTQVKRTIASTGNHESISAIVSSGKLILLLLIVLMVMVLVIRRIRVEVLVLLFHSVCSCEVRKYCFVDLNEATKKIAQLINDACELWFDNVKLSDAFIDHLSYVHSYLITCHVGSLKSISILKPCM